MKQKLLCFNVRLCDCANQKTEINFLEWHSYQHIRWTNRTLNVMGTEKREKTITMKTKKSSVSTYSSKCFRVQNKFICAWRLDQTQAEKKA